MSRVAWKTGVVGALLFLSPILKLYFGVQLIERWEMYSQSVPICYTSAFEDHAGYKPFKLPAIANRRHAKIYPSSMVHDVQSFMDAYCASIGSDSSTHRPTSLYFDVYCSNTSADDANYWTLSLSKGKFTCLTSNDSASSRL